MPTHRALALSYARVLGERNTRDSGTRAVAVLRPLLGSAGNDPLFQQAYARANEIAGDDVRAGEAWAEAAYLGGRPEQALVQLNNLKKRATSITTRAAGSRRGSPRSPRPCWNCAARASRTRRPRAAQRRGARAAPPPPGDSVTKPSPNRRVMAGSPQPQLRHRSPLQDPACKSTS